MERGRLIGNFGESLVPAIAGAAGCCYAKPFPDVGSDWKIDGDCDIHDREPSVAIQVKTTTTASHNEDGTVSFELEADAYNKLVKDTTVPRILVVAVIPPEQERWLVCNADHLRAERSVYWMNLRGHPPTDNVRSVTLRVPHTARFDAAALVAILRRIAERGEP